jgi:hypothetical protein
VKLFSLLRLLEQNLHMAPAKRVEILSELQNHVDDRIQEFQSNGLSPAEAQERAVLEIGDPSQLAGAYYNVHETGSWRDVAMATIPHLALAAIFAFHLWTELLWVVVAISAATFIAGVAWRKGAPQWAFPWLGYALAAPMLSWSLAMVAIAYGGWMLLTGGDIPLGVPLYIGIVLYIPLSMVLVIRIVRKAVRHDWLMVSLAALPLPFFATWMFMLHWRQGALTPNKARALEYDADTAIVFLALAITTAMYLKVGRRLWRIGLLILSAPVMVAMAAIAYQASPHTFPTIAAIGLTVALLLSPVLLDAGKPSYKNPLDSPNADLKPSPHPHS